MSSGKKKAGAKATPRVGRKSRAESRRENEREELAGLYRMVYERCMEGETKGFDAKGALSALEGIEKLKGLDEPGAADGAVVLTLSEKVGGRGD